MVEQVILRANQLKNRKKIQSLVLMNYMYGANITESKFKKNILTNCVNILLVSLCFIGLYGQYHYIKKYIHANVADALEGICTALQTIIGIAKTIHILVMQSKFRELFHIAETHQIIENIEILQEVYAFKKKLHKEVNKILDDAWYRARFSTTLFIIIAITIMGFYIFNAIIMNSYHDYIGTPNYTIELPFPALFPSWVDYGMKFPYYHLEVINLATLVYVAAISAAGFDGLVIVLTQHGLACYKILNLLLVYSTHPSLSEVERTQYLKYCIKHYYRTYDYCNELDRLYRHLVFLQISLSMLVLAIVLYIGSVGLEGDLKTAIRMTMFINAVCFEISIYNISAQFVTSESDKLPLTFYSCEWYNESKEFKDLIKMMILRTNRTFYFNASWFTTLSVETLMALIKNSVSYFLLLKSLSDEG